MVLGILASAFALFILRFQLDAGQPDATGFPSPLVGRG
jgi:hypothetical protein